MMKLLVIAIMIFPVLSFSEVTIHEEPFQLVETQSGDHFWGRLYEWKEWLKTPEQKKIKLTTNFVKEAYKDGDTETKAKLLSLRDFEEALNDEYEGKALNFSHENTEEADEDEVVLAPDSALVSQFKISVKFSKEINLEKLNLNTFSKYLVDADKPHMHKEVSHDFMTRFLEPMHSSHKYLAKIKKNNKKIKIYMSIVNTGNKQYQCRRLNAFLKLQSISERIPYYDSDYRIYTANVLKELSAAEISNLKNVISPGAIKVFEQRTIYASTLIKSGIVYFSFYKNTEGAVRMVSHTILVSTAQVTKSTSMFINGPRTESRSITFSKGVSLLSEANVNLEVGLFNCKIGLGRGIAGYVYNLAKKLASE